MQLTSFQLLDKACQGNTPVHTYHDLFTSPELKPGSLNFIVASPASLSTLMVFFSSSGIRGLPVAMVISPFKNLIPFSRTSSIFSGVTGGGDDGFSSGSLVTSASSTSSSPATSNFSSLSICGFRKCGIDSGISSESEASLPGIICCCLFL